MPELDTYPTLSPQAGDKLAGTRDPSQPFAQTAQFLTEDVAALTFSQDLLLNDGDGNPQTETLSDWLQSFIVADHGAELVAHKGVASGYQGLDSNSDLRLPASVVAGGILTGGAIRRGQSIMLDGSYTQTVPPTDEALHPGVRVNWHATLSDNGGGLGPVYGIGGADASGPPGVFDVSGVVQFGADTSVFTFTPISFGNVLKVKNTAGVARTITPAWHFMEAGWLYADAAVMTLRGNDINGGGAGFVSNQTWGTKNAGTLTGMSNSVGLVSFLSMDYALGNTHIPTRYGSYFLDLNNYLGSSNAALLETAFGLDAAGGGTVDKQVAYGVPFLTGGTKNYGIENGSATVELPRTATISSAASVIPVTSTVVHLNNTSGGAVTLTGTPCITAGVDGQTIKLVNISANTITLPTGGGSGLVLGAPTRILSLGGALALTYSTTAGGWVGIGQNPGPTGTMTLGTSNQVTDGTAAHGKIQFNVDGFGAAIAAYTNSADVSPVANLSSAAKGIAFGPGGGAGNPTEVTIGWSATSTLTITDGSKLNTGTGTGLMIASAAGQKLGLYGVTPVAQQASNVEIRAALVNLGVWASGGTNSLNLGSGSLAAGTTTLAGTTLSGNLTMGDGLNIITNTSTGTVICSTTSQKVAFFGNAPLAQRSANNDLLNTIVQFGFQASGGVVPLNLNGGALSAGAATFTGNVTVSAVNIVTDTTTGTQIGTASGQKVGFLGATPAAQQGSATDLRTLLITFGFLATGGATPLNLNGGILTTSASGGAIVFSGLVDSGATAELISKSSGTSMYSVRFGNLGGTATFAVVDNVNTVNTLTAVGGSGTTGVVTVNGALKVTGNFGAFNTTPVTQRGAYTQTFSTAVRTQTANTAATLTDNSAGTANTTLEALTSGSVYATDVAAIRNNFADLAAMVNKNTADTLVLAKLIVSLIDDQQALGFCT